MNTSKHDGADAPLIGPYSIPIPHAPFPSTQTGDAGTARAVPHLTHSLLGLAIPDRIQIGIFADHPRILRNKESYSETRHAIRYFDSRRGATYHADPGDPLGPCYVWREGQSTMRFGIGPRSFSMSVIFNPVRELSKKHGTTDASARHGNTIIPLLKEGYQAADLRRGLCQDIAERAEWAKGRYIELCPRVLGRQVHGAVSANFSQVEFDYDFHI